MFVTRAHAQHLTNLLVASLRTMTSTASGVHMPPPHLDADTIAQAADVLIEMAPANEAVVNVWRAAKEAALIADMPRTRWPGGGQAEAVKDVLRKTRWEAQALFDVLPEREATMVEAESVERFVARFPATV